ncbi:MAG: ABC transporter permease [Gammaproteobacteria bacterium]|nr:ABC transporter permease [Gammaproteobacteria bacterium]MCP5146398.1 ABC transporter permease [Gammaproteobacteria bacterium]
MTTGSGNRWLHSALTVFRKEFVDALRDRKSLVVVLLAAVLMGPAMMFAMSVLIGRMEASNQAREITVAGIEYAPTLANYLSRQSYTVKAAPADFKQGIAAGSVAEAVLVIPADFSTTMADGRNPKVELYFSAAHQRSASAVQRARQLIGGFNREQSTIKLAMRGIAPAALSSVELNVRDLADRAARGAQLLAFMPFMLMMAVLYGCLAAALDTTAGERERGSLEPLLMTPVRRSALIAGKWAAVACVGMLITLLAVGSYLPARLLINSETLRAMFNFGPAEALAFLYFMLPLSAAIGAVLMAIAVRCRTFKEAQANSAIAVFFFSLVPMVEVFNQGAAAPWFVVVPGLGQISLMNRLMRHESIAAMEWLTPLITSFVLIAVAIWLISRALHRTAVGR